MAYVFFKAIAIGTVGGASGIAHFDPKRADEGGRYKSGVIPADIATKAVDRGYIKVMGEATEKDYRAQIAGISVRPADAAARRLAKMEDAPRTDGSGSASATAVMRNFPEGQGRQSSLIDPDAAPLTGSGDDDDGKDGDTTGDPLLKLSVPKLKAKLAEIDDVARLTELHTLEEQGQNRDSAKAAIDERKQEIAKDA